MLEQRFIQPQTASAFPNQVLQTIAPQTPILRWHLADLRMLLQGKSNERSFVEYKVVNQSGSPIENVDVLLAWRDGFTTTWTNREGYASLQLWDRIDPVTQRGPCWASLVDSAEKIEGLGVPTGQSVIYRLTYVLVDSTKA